MRALAWLQRIASARAAMIALKAIGVVAVFGAFAFIGTRHDWHATHTPPVNAAAAMVAFAPNGSSGVADRAPNAAAEPDAGALRPAEDAGATASGAITADGRLVLNLASEDELRRLPGVGPTRARAIIALRTRLGRFHRIEDLLRIKRFGRRSLARLRPLLLVDPP